MKAKDKLVHGLSKYDYIFDTKTFWFLLAIFRFLLAVFFTFSSIYSLCRIIITMQMKLFKAPKLDIILFMGIF